MTIRQTVATFVLGSALLVGAAVTAEAGTAEAADMPPTPAAASVDLVAQTAAAALGALGTDRFSMRLEDVSFAVAAELETDAGRLNQAWAAADQAHQIALLSALTQVGVPYHRNSSKEGIAFDCSGLTAFAWRQNGIELARHSSTQLRNASPRTIDTAQPGDLVYYPGHVMIWLGVDNLIVHAPHPGKNVEVGTIGKRRIRGAKFANPIG